MMAHPTTHPRKTQVMHSSKVYTRLQEQLGLQDHAAVLNLMLSKIAKNLQVV